MLSLHQAIEIRESIFAYLKATFSFQDQRIGKAFDEFIHDPEAGLFKGPYLSLKLPFVKADATAKAQIPLDIYPDWDAYDHQINSWHRLSTHDQAPKPTIITTGTGSGKTESFLYPVLDYCYQRKEDRGIKVIILYPMNALASDQAKRLAEAIYEDERLQGKITAGLFIGEGKNKGRFPKSMGSDHIIEDRESILASPPDILLTNFKMLDYGLMKANYHDLWTYNFRDTGLLRFLVLDELHTYDGAQGTDVANLIRRLKLKLDLPQGQLCPVGTSATIGSGEDAPLLLAEYAAKIFGETITPEAIITENRQQPEDFFGPDEELEKYLPRAQKLRESLLRKDEDFEQFVQRQINLWQMEPDNLAEELRRQLIVKDLVALCNEGKGLKSIEELGRGLARRNEGFHSLPQWDEDAHFAPPVALIESLFTLISVAKEKGGRPAPFLFTQTQLWIRELSGIQRAFWGKPRFVWRENSEQEATKALPPWFCRECGSSGWLGVKQDNREHFEPDINEVYNKFFSNHKNLYFVVPYADLKHQDLKEMGYDATDVLHEYVFEEDLHFYEGPDEGRLEVLACRKLDSRNKNDHVCPSCNTRNSLAIIGTRIATLSSIAMSQTLATDLDLQVEKDRKVLAFTNAVQDAAHQAGFIEARNYRFTLRSSLQKVINQQDGPISLGELAKVFRQYWKKNADESGKKPLDAYYYRFFPKDYIGKSSPEDYFDNGKYVRHFQQEFDTRIDWEIMAEFGYDALIGRTLEKTGASAVFFHPESLRQCWEEMQPWIATNALPGSILEADFLCFLQLLLNRIRTRGAVSHPYLEKFRTQSLKLWDLNWMRDKRHYLNKNFGPRSRFPRLLTAQSETRGLLDSTFARTTNWFHVYFKRSFTLASDHLDFINEFFLALLEAMHTAGLLDRRQSQDKDLINYALNPENIWVHNQVNHLACSRCGHEIHTAEAESTAIGGSCLHYRCQGKYQPKEETGSENYYQAVYNRHRSPRIYAGDHTGLLERSVREKLEIDFKQRPDFNSTNALVATSTLEMGIDIGTLNTVYNTSVPPLPANFLQRVGRAGRSSGSALVVNFAQNKAHDLFYYQGPLDMMAGEVGTPGCYLEAKEILRRHFFAFCMDSWAAEAPKKHHVPLWISNLKLASVDLQSEGFFMNQLTNFIKIRETALFTRFQAQYPQLEPVAFADLQSQLKNEQFYHFYLSIFRKLKEEIADLNQKRRDIKDRIKTLKLGEEDPERIELEKDTKNLGGIVHSIQDRNTLEHMTNVGGLPNYAFPESGVILTARVLGNQAEQSDHPPVQKEFEIVRAASQAIHELAPDNFFYSQGYKLQISGVNTFDWSDTNVYHKKRFCSQCDHIAPESTAPKGNCSKCGHESWNAASNVHSFARLSTVKSFNSRSGAAINDSKDEREKLMYHRQRHFTFDESSSLGAWAILEVPFGIEFVKNVLVLDANLGRSDVTDARKIVISEEEVPTHGFITCRHCGKSSSHINQPKYKEHYGYCKHKEVEYADIADEVFEEVFFFREFRTEALKVLLPVQELNSEAEVRMFKAGLERGLKEYYRGNPQHIVISDYKEYNHQSLRFDRYLVLFDMIPGGTGYLSQLFDRKEFNQLLKQAYESIRDCTCQHEGKDGCYRCIYSYGNQYYQGDLSRERAEKRFRAIVQRAEGWEFQPNGLSSVSMSGRIEESELEERFIRSLDKFAAKKKGWSWEEKNLDGTINYLLRYQDPRRSVTWHIRPQVDLGPSDGVAFHTRTDFLFICTEARLETEEYQDTIPSLAVYLDGYQYHASESNNRFHNDFRKRQAIAENSAYRSWTLTWADMERFDQLFLDEKRQDNRDDYLYRKLRQEGYRRTKKGLFNAVKTEKFDLSVPQNNLERLLGLLEYPFSNQVFGTSWALFFASFQEAMLSPSFAPEEKEKALGEELADARYCLTQKSLDGLLRIEAAEPSELCEYRTLVNLTRREIFSQLMLSNLDKIEIESWNQFWTYYNLVRMFELEEVQTFTRIQQAEEEGLDSERLESLLPLYEDAYHPLLMRMFQKGYIRSEQDELQLNTLLDSQGAEIAQAELIIAQHKMVLEPYDKKHQDRFVSAGFQIVALEDINKIEL